MRLFAKELVVGFVSKELEGKTKDNTGTLPLALSMMQRKYVDSQQNGETQKVQSHSVVYWTDVVALKHDYKRYLESFFLVVLCEDLHIDSDKWALCSWRSRGTKSAMLESKLRTGTSTTKKMQICLDEVALFWMSQWTACSPAWRILYHVTASCKGPINREKA